MGACDPKRDRASINANTMAASTATEYLTKVGIEDAIAEVLDLLLEHRPTNSVSLITDFFQAKLVEMPTATTAYRQLQIAKRDNG